MAASPTILPDSYFDGLSTLWGSCAYVASAVAAAGLVFQAVRIKPEPAGYVWLFLKVFIIGISTLFLREWLMRLNDIVMSFGAALGVNPQAVDNRYVSFLSGTAPSDPNTSVWDVIWGTSSIGTALCYALLWLFGWLSWGIQYVVKLVGGVLLTAGWALSPLFLSFFLIPPMSSVALKYIIGLVALVCWPFGWVIAAVVTNAMIDAAATASLLPVIVPGSVVAPVLTVLLVGAWMIVSAILAPYITTRILLMGSNPAAAFAQGVGDVAQAGFAGGVGAATALATGGATAGAIVAAAAVGSAASATESAARGGASARTAYTASAGLAGLYGTRFGARQTAAMQEMAKAQKQRASAAEAFANEFGRAPRNERSRQPHQENPNQAAIEIEAYAKS